MKTISEIIKETVEFYSADTSRRGLTKQGNCRYITEDWRKCALGRCCEDEWLTQMIGGVDLDGLINLRDKHERPHIDTILKEEYRGHPPRFWQMLQCFHDSPIFWSDTGLTLRGETYLLAMRQAWC